jgi:hypothetical protein
MVFNPRPIRLASARDVNQRLDAWSAEHLGSAGAWSELLAACRDWPDYSARNQLLLGSYGAAGPVAGIETWRLIPTREGTGCVVRGGEHGLPVRVPITTVSNEPDPHLGRARPTTAAVEGWEWRSVFCLEQLARRPDPEQLRGPDLPDDLADRFPGAVRQLAARTLRGRGPKLDDPLQVLAQAAGRQPRSAGRAAPNPELAAQIAWLVADQLRQATGALPEFDPMALPNRERWESLLDVLDGSRRLLAGIGKGLGVDLLASPLPRMAIEDDRVVPAGRRNRLPRASLAQLPVGQWVEVGPYTADEWAARGETAIGRGAYLRINTTAYLVAVEHGDRSAWRLEDTRARLGAGRLAGGDETTLDAARTTALVTIRHRYPQLIDAGHQPETPVPAGTRSDWVPLPDRPGSHRFRLDGQVAAYVIGVGDRWLPMIERTPGQLLEGVGPALDNEPDARALALQAARTALKEQPTASRVDLDTAVALLATSPAFSHARLVDLIATRLDEPDRQALTADPPADELTELLGRAGVTPATTIVVLHAEGTTPEVAAAVLPGAGVAPTDAIGALHDLWGIGRVEAAEWVGATASEMRAAGCAASEILAARPIDVLQTLPPDPHLWELCGGTLAVAGHSPYEIVGFLASHAPNPDCYAAGLAAAVDDPTTGLDLSQRRGMPPSALAAASERYELSPDQTATTLADAGIPGDATVQVLIERCGGDPELTTQIARSTIGLRTDTIIEALQAIDQPMPSLAELRNARPLSRDRDALLAAHRPPTRRPVPGVVGDAQQLLAALPEPTGPPAGPDADDLLGVLPEPTLAGPGDRAVDTQPAPQLDHHPIP